MSGGVLRQRVVKEKREASDVVMASGAELERFRLYVMLLCIIYTRELSIHNYSLHRVFTGIKKKYMKFAYICTCSIYT